MDNIAGEGGEYETLTLDCPLYKKKIQMYFFFFPS
jgi:diphthine-ammonia ligase